MLDVRTSVRPYVDRPLAFSFLVDNVSKCQQIFTKLGMCIDIVETCFGIANGQIMSTFDSYLPATHAYFRFRMITYKCQWIFP